MYFSFFVTSGVMMVGNIIFVCIQMVYFTIIIIIGGFLFYLLLSKYLRAAREFKRIESV